MFLAVLRKQGGTAARTLEFAVLTAARSGEVFGARWSEIDLQAAVWTVPADRMKAGREHRVPLSESALDVLRHMEPSRPASGDGFIFPGQRTGRPLSNMAMTVLLRRMQRCDLTVHGFRSSFRDWCAETGKANDIAEAALAHTIGNKVQVAYQRGDLLDRRRELMEAWAGYCDLTQLAPDCQP